MSKLETIEYDVVVVGSGAAGMVTAISAAAEGLKVVIVEKAPVWGGTTAMSGGGFWVAGNDYQKAAGISDSFEEAMTFLDVSIPDEGPVTSRGRKEALARNGNLMTRLIASKGVELQMGYLHDYFANNPGAKMGRHVEPKSWNGRKLGPLLDKMRWVPISPFPVDASETPRLARGHFPTMAKVYLRYKLQVLMGRRPLAMGANLAAQLMLAAQKSGVELKLDSPVKDLIRENGRVVGVVAESNGKREEIRARAGVMLSAGGFAKAAEFRKKHQGVTGAESNASDDDTGDIIQLADRWGLQTAMLDVAWWIPSLLLPPDKFPLMNPSDRSLPGSIMVNGAGKRFTNECENYNYVGNKMIEKGIDDPTWLIIDTRHRNRYMVGRYLPGQNTRELVKNGFLKTGRTIEELATQIGVPPANLRETIDRWNRQVDEGRDSDFGRGESAYNRQYGDARSKPNPNMGRIDQAPFYATRFHLGDLGTKGGLVTDEHARVVGTDGKVVEGLYAAGNTTASVMGRAYPGPGSTLGPAMTFGYIAGQHMAARATNRGVAASRNLETQA